MTTPAVNRPMNLSEWTMLLTLSILWGGSFFFVGLAVRELPTLTIVVSRLALAALVLLAVLFASGRRLPTAPAVWAAFLGMGFLNNAVPFSLIVWGQAHIASGLASILNATAPLFTVIVAHVLTRDEKMTGGRLAGVVIGLAGVVAMVGIDALGTLGGNLLAQLACLGAALSYAFAGIFGRRFRRMGIDPLTTATGQVVASSLLLAPAMLVIDRPWTLPAPGAVTIAAIVAIATLSTAAAYVLYFRILATAGATNILLVTFIVPVSAILLGVFVLGETLAPRHLFGMALIGAGLAAIDGRPGRAARAMLGRRSGAGGT